MSDTVLQHDLHDREYGLAHCKICNGAESSLTTECVGRKLDGAEEYGVSRGIRDFKDGKWQRIMLPPVRLCCGERHVGPVCLDGKVMCCLCFERKSIEELNTTPDGEVEDVCKTCAAKEQEQMQQTQSAFITNRVVETDFAEAELRVTAMLAAEGVDLTGPNVVIPPHLMAHATVTGRLSHGGNFMDRMGFPKVGQEGNHEPPTTPDEPTS